MYLKVLVIFCLSIVRPFVCYDEMGESENPIFEYLGIEHNSIAEHELVNLDLSESFRKRDLRDGRQMSFRAFGNNINLWLRPGDPTFVTDETPVYYAQWVESSIIPVRYELLAGALKNLGRVLEDPKHLASVIFGSDDSGRTTVTGYLRSRDDNSRLVIRPLPGQVAQGYLRKKRSIDETSDDFTNSTYHVLLKLNDDDSENPPSNSRCGVQSGEMWDSQNMKLSNYENNYDEETYDTIYPRMLIHTDSSFANDTSPEKINHFLEYIVVFWNSVNLMYRHVEIPKVRLNIAGIIIGKHRKVTPFIVEHMRTADAFHSNEAIFHATDFYFQMREFIPVRNYNLIATMTKFRMGSTSDYTTVGIAFVNGACTYSHVLLIRETGACANIQPAAHELGHLFGLRHDDETLIKSCSEDIGYIMTAIINPTNYSSLFSQCSLNSLASNFRAGNLSCMYEAPVLTGSNFPIKLPGKIESLNKQCRVQSRGVPCGLDAEDGDICVENRCTFVNKNGQEKCNKYIGAAPGTECVTKNNQRGICLTNRCVRV